MTLPVAVVIPTFNRKHTLTRAVDSVLAQSQSPQEFVIVDDGSTDGTFEFIGEHYPQIKRLQQDNAGVSAARNLGIAETSAPWLAFLDSDDEWLPGKLAEQFEYIANNPDAEILHCDEIWIRNGRRVNPMQKHQKLGGDIFEQCLQLCAISPSAVVLRRSLLQEWGGFDESLPACEDYDLWLRLCSRKPVHYIDKHLLRKYGGHEDQLSRQHWGMDRFRVTSIAKLLRTGDLTSEQTILVKEALQEKCRVLQLGASKRGNQTVIKECQQLLAEFGIAQNG